MAHGGDAEQVEGAQDIFRHHELQAECEPRVGAGRNRCAEQPERDGGDSAPVEGNEPDGDGGENEQAGREEKDEGEGQGEAHEVV